MNNIFCAFVFQIRQCFIITFRRLAPLIKLFRHVYQGISLKCYVLIYAHIFISIYIIYMVKLSYSTDSFVIVILLKMFHAKSLII